ncbi:MAG TPA: cyclic dehypoxanthinyl futalosine synthase [bacterium]|jgi:cyclic dehypoxanthinyl futalosine synthase
MRNEIEEKIYSGERLSDEESLWCIVDADLWDLGRWAHQIRNRLHPEHRVTYQVDRNINYTNVCNAGCKFCAFARAPRQKGGWTLTIQEILKKVQQTVDRGGTGILMQGGHNPYLPLEYYTDLVSAIKENFPEIHIHAFSPSEIVAFSEFFEMTIEEVIKLFIDHGLDSIPGGGAEILTEPTRARIARGKADGEQWLNVMRIAHNLGLRTTATMVIGFGESNEERFGHLKLLRDLQDETGGFTAFIPWTFQPGNTVLEGKIKPAGAYEYLRAQAYSRIILDNVEHHQTSWLTQSLKIASMALYFGADDFSSIMMEENVVSAAGSHYCTDEDEMMQVIRTAGFEPMKRLTLYQNIYHV